MTNHADGGPEAPSRSGLRSAGRGFAHGAGVVGRATARSGRAAGRAARRASSAGGAGESGLSRLIEVHAASMAGDAAVTVGLAGTVFFSAPSGQAQGQTLRFLVLTMLPFAILAPLVGPLLDRLRHGRRWAIGATLALRAFLCWVLAGAIDSNSTMLFPVAMGVLVASKAYLVSRSAATPRLLPRGMTLVKANGRLSLAGVAGAAIGGPLAGVASKVFGPAYALRVAFVLFVVGTVLAILLPPRVDSSIGEEPASMGVGRGNRVTIHRDVVSALRANAGLRWLSGFLTIFLAFLMRNHPFAGWEDRKTLLLALVVGAAGAGNVIGTVMGSALKVASPRVIVVVTLVADAAAAVVAALFFDLRTAILVGLVAGIGQQLGKLALDSLIQDKVREDQRTSVFGRSETLLQLSWVIGGIVAVVMPTGRADIGMITAAVVLVAWAAAVLILRPGRALPEAVSDEPRRPATRPMEQSPRLTEPATRPMRQARPRPSYAPRPARPTRPREERPFDVEETIGISREQVRRYRPADERDARVQPPQPRREPQHDDRPRWERDLDGR